MTHKPQFTLEQLYISPFTGQRHFDDEGRMYYTPLERNLTPSGIQVMDRYLQFLMSGGFYRPTFCAAEGITTAQLAALVTVLTGYNVVEFQNLYVIQVAEQLMRYTSLSIDYIARHYGGINASNFCRMYKRIKHVSPGPRRAAMRQPGDEDRYTVK